MTTIAKLVINEQNPWPGLGAFDEASERFFNGRASESAELRRLVLQAPLTVLFGASGLGKTSLVQAGLFPLLRKDHLLPVYVRLDLRDRNAPLIEQVKVALTDEIHAHQIDAPTLNRGECLWHYLHRGGLELWSEQNQLLTPLLVFDQFEEVFTLGAENTAAIARLRTDLADLVENRLPATVAKALRDNEAVGTLLSLDSVRYKVLLSFREDFLPAVEGWKRELPSILRNRFRLLPMSSEQAFEAVHTTAAHLVGEPLARRIVRFVAAAQEEEIGRAPEELGNTTELAVEPALLSVVCHGLNEKRKAQGKAAFDEALLSGAGQAIISDYYRRAVGELPKRVQHFIEEELITERGFRKPCDVDDARSIHGVTDHELRLLIDRRLLRVEPHRGTDRLELTHDLLTRVVRDHRDRQRERERARRQRRRMGVFAIISVLLAGVVVVFFLLYRTAERAREFASLQLAAQAQVGADLDQRAPYNLLLALESVRITQQIGAFSPTASRQLLNAALNTTGGLPLQHGGPVAAVGVSPDDRWLATASAGNVQLWDMHAPSAKPTTLRGLDKVNALAFSPDGRTLATVGDDATLRLWDTVAADRAASMRVLTGHRAAIVDVAFSRNGRWLATGSKDGTARLWDFAAAEPATAVAILPNGRDVNTLAFSPDNRWLATGSSDGTVRLWDLLGANPSHEPIQRLIKIGMDVRKVAFSPDSQWMVAGDTESYKVVLMRVTAPDKQFVLRVWQWVSAVAFSPDSRWLATPSQYNARIWDLNKPDPSSEPLILGGHKNYIADLAFSPDGNWFATGSADHTVQLWNAANGFAAPAVLRGHEGQITALVFSHDSRHLITASNDGTARLWNISSPHAEPLALIPSTADGATELRLWGIRAVNSPAAQRVLGGGLDEGAGTVFSPDGQWLATIPAGVVDFVHLWNLSTPSPSHYLVRHEGGIWASPVFSPDGRWLATGGVSDPTIRLWDLKKPDPTSSPQVLRGHWGPVRSLAFSSDGHRLVSGANDGLALVWDLTTADPSASPKRFAGRDIIRAVAISADGRYLATGSWEPDNAACIWDLSAPVSSRPISTLTFKGRVFDVAFSPDGRWFAAGSWDYTTQLLDLKKQGTKPFVLRGHTGRTLSVAFSADSQWLATGNEDVTARLWNLTVADPSADSTVLRATYKVGNVSFSPDGRWLALTPTEYRSSPFSPDGHWFASSGTNALLYHVRLEDLILLACRTAGRNLTKSEWEKSFGDQPYRKTCSQLP